MSERNLVLLGPPGAGKGTQADRLRNDFGLPYYSTGIILREAVAEESELGKEAKKYMDDGELVPDDVIVGVIGERIAQHEAADGFILDGFPRNLEQASALEQLLAERGEDIDAVVEFQVPEDELVRRLLGRGRTDDTEDVIRRRQQVYRDETAPLLEHYRDRLVTIDAVGSVEEITDRVADALRKR